MIYRICLLLLLVSARGMPAEAQLIRKINGRTITAGALSEKIRVMMKQANVSGLAISVFNDNQPVYSKTFGLGNVQEKDPLGPNQVMYGASFSKAVFAYIVMQLVQEKKIDLNQPVVHYLTQPLPDYKIRGWNRGYADLRNDKRYEKITGKMCMSHTTGFPNWRWFEPDKKLKIKFEPGSRYSYSGEGMYLLQFVIEQVTGKDYETLAQERVFGPLGMAHTSYVWQDRFADHLILGHNDAGVAYDFMHWKEASCAGSLCTTLNDYTKFYAALMQHKGLTAATFNQLLTPQVRIRSIKQFGPLSWKDSTLNDDVKLSYGLGLGLLSTPYGRAFFKEGHDDGWGHYSIAYPEKGIGIVIMTNNDNGEHIFRELLAQSIGDTFTPWLWEDYIPWKAPAAP